MKKYESVIIINPKLEEKEIEMRHEEMKKRKEKSVLKSVENFKKLM